MKNLFGGIRASLGFTGTTQDNTDNEDALKSALAARAAMESFRASGLFQKSWYLSTYRDIAAAKVDPFQHFLQNGWKEGRRPNPFFDPPWYLSRNADVTASGTNPLLHYWFVGERQNRQPCALFDTKWYRETYGAELGSTSPLAHYLANRHLKKHSPNSLFDVSYYLETNADVADADVDPLEHFVTTGFREGRRPSAQFDVAYYVRKYLRDDPRDPITHYLEIGRSNGCQLARRPDERTQSSEIRRFTSRGPHFEEFNRKIASARSKRAKAIAFYLPQFHSFPENDAWWGNGFTEWTNIARGTPRFVDHYQPRVPRDFGFYDLTNPDVLRKQTALAREAGLFGFCFYYYNFNGKRLLEKPVDAFLGDRTNEFPFCLMWANENWTRRWDGAESEVLMRQDYKIEDATQIVDDLARHFRDPRYITIDNRPLLLIYRADVIPDTRKTVAEWRRLFRSRHDVMPLMFMAQAFNNLNPGDFGFDGAFEFPPHKVVNSCTSVTSTCDTFDDSFSAQVFRYSDVIEASLQECTSNFPLIKTAVPSWDNDARRQGQGLVLTGSTPQAYEHWLASLVELSRERPVFGESLVLINAWNEWAEGAYLEPDLHFGSSYLNATARAITGKSELTEKQKLLLVGHDAFPAGAQLLLLNLGKVYARQFGIQVEFVLCSDGELLTAYQEVAPTHVVSNTASLQGLLDQLAARGFKQAITNTTATGYVVPELKSAGMSVVSLIHELPRIVEEKSLKQHAKEICTHSDAIVFPTSPVRDAYLEHVASTDRTVHLIPQGMYQHIKFDVDARATVRAELGLSLTTKIVLNVGYGDLRKGVDLFCSASQLVASQFDDVCFVWAGSLDPACAAWLRDDNAYPNVRFLGPRNDITQLLSAADVFALTSREDPYPSVILEAIAAGVPPIAFENGGGFTSLLKEGAGLGTLVPHSDIEALSQAIVQQLQRLPADRERQFNRLVKYAEANFEFDTYAWSLLDLTGIRTPKLSVIVPNYNYARYIGERLTSIFQQTSPLFEIIVLDDCSSDESLAIARETAQVWERVVRFVPNEENSGSPFAQWQKGLELARGKLIWIAEADDLSSPHFLDRLLKEFEDPEMVLAVSDSLAIGPDGEALEISYKSYYSRVYEGALLNDICCQTGEFAKDYLSQRNTLLNVSAIVWRRDALSMAFQFASAELQTFRLAADWLLYLAACRLPGKVAYSASELNLHRRHDKGVTSTTSAEKQLSEIARVQGYFVEHFGTDDRVAQMQANYLIELESQFSRST